MFLIQTMTHVSDGLNTFTTAGNSFYAAVGVWLAFWRSLARGCPTEWKNRYVRYFFKTIYFICCVMGLYPPDIAKIDWKNWRIISRSEMTATRVVNASVKDPALVENPQPPAASKSQTEST